jgi:hypothetical protein
MEQSRIPKFRSTVSEISLDDKYTRDEYLEMVHDFKSSFPSPVVETYNDIKVVREDLLHVGSKARAGEALIAKCPNDKIVYVQPRFGYAGISLTELCKKYGKKLVLFMPSSKEISEHQAFCIENGCEYHFYRIAAMPNLNRIAQAYAKETGSFFIPLGLKHPLVTAMIIKTAIEIPEPTSFWTAFSTGVLNRALQKAWPNAEANGLAVARNIHPGEKGRAKIIGHYQDFSQNAKIKPPFPSASNYDAKVWEYLKPGDLFWNVAGDLISNIDKKSINSFRNW